MIILKTTRYHLSSRSFRDSTGSIIFKASLCIEYGLNVLYRLLLFIALPDVLFYLFEHAYWRDLSKVQV